MRIWTIAALLLFMQAPAPQQARKARIEGYVVRAETSEPLEGARITIRRTGDAGQSPLALREGEPAPETLQSTTTDGQGRFIIDGLDVGSYEFSAAKNGFARQVYGERTPGRPGTMLKISEGQILNDFVFRLVAAGAVSGRVTNLRGEPIPGTVVQLLRSTYDSRGKRTFQPVSSARTNERGEYRMYLITPGRFFVSAAPAGTSRDPSMMTANQVEEPGFVLTYFPGSSDPSGAASIDVQPGAEAGAIDFRLIPQRLFRIRGRVIDTRTASLPRAVQLEIHPRGAGSPGGGSPVAYNGTNGTFEVRDVTPGSYWIQAQLLPETLDFQLSLGDLLKNMTQVPVEVSNADVENIVVTFSPGFPLQGRLEIEGSGNAASQEARQLIVNLEPDEPSPVPPLPQTVKPDGTFTIENLLPGDYRIHTEGGPRNSYIKSAHLGRTDVMPRLTISGPVPEPLEIVLSTMSGEVEGTVVDNDRKPMSGAQVVLIPDRERSRRDLYRTTASDQNGHFTIPTIVPGEYKLFAWEDLEPFAYNDLDFLRKYEGSGTSVAVSESSKLTVEAKMIPASQ